MKRTIPITMRMGLMAWSEPMAASSPMVRSQYFGMRR
jgi:hypothetical protein